MLFFILVPLLMVLNPTSEFDAGFLELKTSVRQIDRDTTHYSITVCALCRATVDYLRTAYRLDTSYLEKKFNQTNGQCPEGLVNDIVSILSHSQNVGVNPWQFATTVNIIASANTKTDLKEAFKADSHFDSEQFLGGSHLVLKRYQATLDSILKADNNDQARRTFGEMLHTLQDFYSHTNFIELEHTSPSDVLGQRLFREDEYASANMRTCVSCKGEDCQTKPNLDETIQQRKLLTSGYFIPIGFGIFKQKKPKGKCSHGGIFDGSENDEPIGGINKDKLDSAHGHLHYRAANMAYRASVKILTDLRKQIGDDAFGLFLTLKKNLNSLVISIDTECSIADYVELAKNISMSIVKLYSSLEFAPHNYILTSFDTNKASFVVNSRKPEDLTEAIRKLNSCQKKNSSIIGGMYYQSLIEGLKKSEYLSVIFTFTDSPARDPHWKHQARALLRSKRAVIYSFMGQEMKRQRLKSISNSVDYDGTDLASISGGLTYPITTVDQSVISEFILRRLEWTRLQSLLMLKSRSVSAVFYVDSSMAELYLDLSSMGEFADLSGMNLYRPDNSSYPLSQGLINTKHLYMWKISRPMMGAWRLIISNLSPGFDFDVQVQAKTNLVCSSTLQKQMEANTDTSGYTQLTTEPVIDSSLFILTVCDDLLVANASIFLVNQMGNIIQSYSPMQTNQLGILTEIRVPREQFRIETIVTLSNGTQVQRMEKQLHSPTSFSIELTNQPYVISNNQTIQMNYTIRTATIGQVTVLLQITDTLRLLGNDSIERYLTFTKEISGMETITLKKTDQKQLTTDSVIFTVLAQNNQTKRLSYENDETVFVYSEFNSASITGSINYCIFLSLLFLHKNVFMII